MDYKDRSYAASGDVLGQGNVAVQGSEEARKVLRNTYMLLGMTLAFSAVMAGVSVSMGWRPMNTWLTLGIYFALIFAITKFRNSGLGVALVFAMTGFLGATLGPMLGYLMSSANGSQVVMMAMGGTAIIFFAMSAIALTSKRDFSFMGNFLMVGLIVAFLAGIAAFAFSMPLLSLVVSAAFLLLASGLILYETNQIVRGGETNYVMATVTLYISIYNIFVSLLHILGVFSGDD